MAALKIKEMTDTEIEAGFYRHSLGRFFLVKRATPFGEVEIDNGETIRYVDRRIMKSLRFMSMVEYFCTECGVIFEAGKAITFCPYCNHFSTQILDWPNVNKETT